MLFEIYSEEIPSLLQNEILRNFEKFFIQNCIKNQINLSKKKFFITPIRIIANFDDIESSLAIKIFSETILELSKSFPRRMKWPQSNLEWIRPIRNILLLNKNEAILGKILDFNLSKKTFVDKFTEIKVNNESEYFQILEENGIIYDQNKRIEFIKSEITKISSQKISEKLINEIAGIVERPYAIEAQLPEKFLKLPSELINLVLSKNQKNIIFNDKNREIAKNFLIIANGNQENKNIVLNGNLKVTNARLEDALFYYEIDRKMLSKNPNFFIEKLQELPFYEDSVNNIFYTYKEYLQFQNKISELIFNDSKIVEFFPLLKFDLATGIVSEFPELQGIIGSYYLDFLSQNQNLKEIVKYQYYRISPIDYSIDRIAAKIDFIDKLSYAIKMYEFDKAPTTSGDPYAIKTKIDIIIKTSQFIEDFNLDLLQNFISNELLNEIKNLILQRIIYLHKDKLDKEILNKISNFEIKSIKSTVLDIEEIIFIKNNEKIYNLLKRIFGILKKSDIKYGNFSEKSFINEDIFKLENKLNNEKIIDQNDSQKTKENLAELTFFANQFRLKALNILFN